MQQLKLKHRILFEDRKMNYIRKFLNKFYFGYIEDREIAGKIIEFIGYMNIIVIAISIFSLLLHWHFSFFKVVLIAHQRSLGHFFGICAVSIVLCMLIALFKRYWIDKKSVWFIGIWGMLELLNHINGYGEIINIFHDAKFLNFIAESGFLYNFKTLYSSVYMSSIFEIGEIITILIVLRLSWNYDKGIK